MIMTTVFLQGGEDVKKRTNIQMFREILKLSKRKSILIIPWTSNSREKEMSYREIYVNYFKDVGFKKILFLETEDSIDTARRKFSEADVVYLPGGDPKILYEKITEKGVDALIRSFNGILVGNSAGAILLSKGQTHGGTFYPGIGILDFFVEVHYCPSEPDTEDKSMTVCIPENTWIAIKMPR